MNTYLVLVGRPCDTREYLHNICKKLKLEKSVIFTGKIEDLSGLLRACDCGVYSSNSEGMPTAILEGMTCGLPFIGTDIPGIREPLEHSPGNILVPSNDPNALANAFLFMLAKQDYRKVGSENKRYAECNYSPEMVCREYDDFLSAKLKPHSKFKKRALAIQILLSSFFRFILTRAESQLRGYLKK